MDKNRVVSALVRISQLESVLELYRIDNGEYPTTEQGLSVLLHMGSRRLDHLHHNIKPDFLLDPWGNPFQYRAPGYHNPQSFDVWSFGADGLPGGICVDEDLGNWKVSQPLRLECPGRHPIVKLAIAGLILTVPIAISALFVLALVRLVYVRHQSKPWSAIFTPLPIRFWLAVLVASYLIALSIPLI